MESLFEKSNIARQKGRYWRRIRNSAFLILLFGFFSWGAIRYYYPVEEGFETGELIETSVAQRTKLLPLLMISAAYALACASSEGKLKTEKVECPGDGGIDRPFR